MCAKNPLIPTRLLHPLRQLAGRISPPTNVARTGNGGINKRNRLEPGTSVHGGCGGRQRRESLHSRTQSGSKLPHSKNSPRGTEKRCVRKIPSSPIVPFIPFVGLREEPEARSMLPVPETEKSTSGAGLNRTPRCSGAVAASNGGSRCTPNHKAAASCRTPKTAREVAKNVVYKKSPHPQLSPLSPSSVRGKNQNPD